MTTPMTRASIDVDGRRRTYRHVVPSRPNAAAPLIVVLHGTTQTGRSTLAFGGGTMTALAERIGADLVALDGYRRAWNDARIRATSAAQKRGMDDVGFVRAVVERFARPVLLVGYSNGGQLVHRLLREWNGSAAPSVPVVGAAIIAAGLPVDEDFSLVGVRPLDVPVLLFHGSGDPVVPYLGGATKLLGRTKGVVRSAIATAEQYAAHGTEPVITRDGELERRDWDRVRLVTQVGVGHVIPNRTTSPAPRFVGPSHRDLDASEEIEAFFGLG
jgi:polyhydroxybutyrate depolymerase